MRIVHICLACFYVDGMAYQENMLPKYHAKEHEVFIITSDYSFDKTGEKITKKKKDYINEFGIPVKVLDRKSRFGKYSRFKDYELLYDTLENIKPDIIFCHGGQFVALKDVIKYCSKNRRVKLYIDQHGDYYNTPVNTMRRRIGQYLIYGYWMRKSIKYVEKFWGVTPWRCEYLHDVYRIPKKYIDFLPMGGDDEKIDFDRKQDISEYIRKKHNIDERDFLIISGGKIDQNKNIDMLMQAIINIGKEDIKLLIFGQPSGSMKDKIMNLAEDKHIRYIGWISPDEVYNYFLASNLAIFPGTHSVLWEQACACGLPAIFRDWPGMHHVDVGGNARFLYKNNINEIEKAILDIYSNQDILNEMTNIAKEKGISKFLYSKIAKISIQGK